MSIEIITGLYLGDAEAAKLRVDHHVAVVSLFPVEKLADNVLHRLAIEIDDLPTANLLRHFPTIIDFIDQHRADCGVLVHCYAGSSRAVACIVAYLIAKSLVKSVEEGLELIIEKNGWHNVNEGFEEQLHLWASMGSCLDVQNNAYKRFQLKMLQETLLLEEESAGQIASITQVGPSEREKACFKCRKCRRNLIRSESILAHDETTRMKDFLHKNRDRKPTEASRCTSVFVEPLSWMAELITGARSGGLFCPNGKCNQKVGHFDWAGIQCSCGKWVSPAIQLQRKQMDAPMGHVT